MNCEEASEHISSAIDGALSADITPQLRDHLSRCTPCRSEFELEQATKRFVRARLPRATAPAELRQRISEAIAREPLPAAASPSKVKLFRPPYWRLVLSVGTAAAAVAVLFYLPPSARHVHTQPVDDNMIHQAYNNYDSILDGKLVPAVASSDPSAVEAFIKPKVHFHPIVPKLKRYALVGGEPAFYRDRCVAHVVYKEGKNVIYLYQACFKDVLDGTSLSLPPNVLAELKRTGWYFENQSRDCSLIVWVVDSSVCCAIADVNRDQLMAALMEGN